MSMWVLVELSDDWLLLFSLVGGKAEVLVMEDGVLVINGLDSGDSEVLGVINNHNLRVLNDEWLLNLDCELLNLVDGALFFEGHFIWDLDLGAVWNLVLNNVGNLDFNLVWYPIVDSHWEFLVDVVGLLFVLGHLNLLGDDIGDLLDDGVVNALGDFIRHADVFFDGDFVDNSVWDDVGDDVWDLKEDGVRHLAAGDVWDLLLDLEWHLSVDCVWNLDVHSEWLKSLNFVFLLNEVSHGDLVWNLCGLNDGNLLGNLVLLFNVLSDDISYLIS